MHGPAVTVYGIDLAIDFAPSRLAMLGPLATQRAAAFHASADRDRFVAAHAGLRRALARHFDVAPESLDLDTPVHKKPVLQDGLNGHFNLTHSADLALVAIAEHGPIGVDVEKIRTLADRDAVAREVFGDSELAELASAPALQQDDVFFQVWTRKEAIIKATGEGFAADLKRIGVTLLPREPAAVVEYPRPHNWQLQAFTPAPGYVAAVALEAAAPIELDWRGVVF